MSSSSDFVRTVTGDVPADRLGHTQCHEHIWLERGSSFRINPALCMDDYARSLAELRAYRAAGGDALVDAQPGGFGRNLEALARLSRESGVRIVSVSGAHKLCFLDAPGRFADCARDALARRFVREMTIGVETRGGRVRTGMLKLALDDGGLADLRYAEIYAGVAEAAAQTGAALMVHAERGCDLRALIDYLGGRGVAMERVLLCHLDRTEPNPDAHRLALDAGCTLCYDSIHRYKYVSDAQELTLINKLVGEGYANQLVLSLDTTNRRLRAYCAEDMGLDEILSGFIPKLRAAGLAEGAIRAMCRDNARRLLRFGGREASSRRSGFQP